MSGIADAFDRMASRASEDPVLAAPGRAVTASGLDTAAWGLDRGLAASWPPPGSLVGLSAPNGPAFVYGLLALRRRDLAPLLLDPKAPSEEHRRMARFLGAAGILRCADGWAEPGAWSLTELVGEAGFTALPEPGVVKLTSGSTGTPRGIRTPDRCLLQDDRALRTTMDISGRDRLLAAIPFSHSYGLSSLVLPCLTEGIPLILPAPGSLPDPMDAAARLEATILPTVPAYLHALLRRSEENPLPPGIRRVISAGALLAPEVAERFRQRTGRHAHVFYGASECGGVCFDRQGDSAERGSVGTPVDGVSIHLGSGSEASGAVFVRSPAVAAGYLPEAREGDTPLSNGRFRSDDLAHWQDGELVLMGRAGDRINVDGRKVNPREVESVLRQLDGVKEAAVCGLSVPGRSGETLCALLSGRTALDYETVVRFCRKHLAPHKVPRSIRWTPEIPSTGRGKVDRGRVRELMASNPPS